MALERYEVDLIMALRDAIDRHDRKADVVNERISNSAQRTYEAIERLEELATKLAEKNGKNGNGWHGTIDMAMKVILILVGIVAMITLGPHAAPLIH